MIQATTQYSSAISLSWSCLARPNSCIFPDLDLVDGALHCTGVVSQGQPGGDGLDVTAQPDGERAQRRQVVMDDGHPPGQRVLVAGQVLDHAGEAGHMRDGSGCSPV